MHSPRECPSDDQAAHTGAGGKSDVVRQAHQLACDEAPLRRVDGRDREATALLQYAHRCEPWMRAQFGERDQTGLALELDIDIQPAWRIGAGCSVIKAACRIELRRVRICALADADDARDPGLRAGRVVEECAV